MRTAALTALSLVAFSCAASAQKLTLLPQVGFENTKTSISYNDTRCISPLGVKFSPQASLQLNYSSKQGHGFFIGAATSRPVTTFSFTDIENGMTQYNATPGNLQVRLEGGYQFNTKPIYFSNNKAKQAAAKNSKGSWMRFQPSIGMGFIPAVKTDVVTKTQSSTTSYQYRAGNMNTAFITGAGFEFGRNDTRLFTLGVNYFNGIGNMGKRTVSVIEAGKTTTTTLQSSVTGWSLRVGIPFNLGKNSTVKNKKEKTKKVQNRCGQQYRIYRCTRTI